MGNNIEPRVQKPGSCHAPAVGDRSVNSFCKTESNTVSYVTCILSVEAQTECR